MTSTSRVFACLAPVCGICLLGSVLTASQAPAQEAPQLSDQHFKNVQALSGNWDSALDFSLYLKTATPAEDATRLAEIIRQRADVQAVTLIPADDALEDLRHAGEPDAEEEERNSPAEAPESAPAEE